METYIGGRRIVWDERKNQQNKKKHHIDFRAAGLVFSDENRLEFYDEAHSVEEDRYITIGLVDEVLFVVFTERDAGNTIRLISARVTTARERRLYYGDT